MAKTAVSVDAGLLQDALNAAEATSQFSNLNDLWKASAEIYNRKKQANQSPITFSIAMLRAKDLDLKYKTQPGRRGRPVTSSPTGAKSDAPVAGVKSGVQVLCVLSGWKESETIMGPTKGEIVQRRWIISGDKYNWGLMMEKPNGTFSKVDGDGYYASFHMLFSRKTPSFSDLGLDALGCLKIIADRLGEITGKKFVVNDTLPMETIAKKIDDFYQVSFHRHEKVFPRIFRVEAAEVVDAVEDHCQS